MKKNKIIFTLIVISIFSMLFTSTAFATTYIYSPYGYHYATVDVDSYTYLWSPYAVDTANAISSWNNCGLNSRSISVTLSSDNKIYQANDSGTWAALYEPLVYDTSYAQTNSYFTTEFQITLNTRVLSDFDDTGKQRAACHELGHALGLGHNDNMVDPASTIMRTTIYNSVSTPQTYDKNAVNALWPNW